MSEYTLETKTPKTNSTSPRETGAGERGFLTAETTAYPVLIDPSITISDNTHGAGAIPDHYCYKNNGEAHCDNPNCYPCNNNGAEAPRCLMTTAQDFVDALDSPDIYCASCREVISQHLLGHHYAE